MRARRTLAGSMYRDRKDNDNIEDNNKKRWDVSDVL